MIPENEIKVDVFRSSGPGGQSVNTTDSAVRMTHLPTGIVVSMQDEKSQIQNRAAALRVLQSRLLLLKKAEEAAERKELAGDVKASWGDQMRSYVLQPYQMVKDLRTEHEVGNPSAVFDGDIDDFIEAGVRVAAVAGEGGGLSRCRDDDEQDRRGGCRGLGRRGRPGSRCGLPRPPATGPWPSSSPPRRDRPPPETMRAGRPHRPRPGDHAAVAVGLRRSEDHLPVVHRARRPRVRVPPQPRRGRGAGRARLAPPRSRARGRTTCAGGPTTSRRPPTCPPRRGLGRRGWSLRRSATSSASTTPAGSTSRPARSVTAAARAPRVTGAPGREGHAGEGSLRRIPSSATYAPWAASSRTARALSLKP